MSLGKAVASTVAQTPGDNALHADAFQDVDSTGFHGSCAADSIRRICSPTTVSPWSSSGQRSSLGPEKFPHLAAMLRFHLMPFEVPGGGWISDNGQNSGESNPLVLLQLNPKGWLGTSKLGHARTPAEMKAPLGDVPLLGHALVLLCTPGWLRNHGRSSGGWA